MKIDITFTSHVFTTYPQEIGRDQLPSFSVSTYFPIAEAIQVAAHQTKNFTHLPDSLTSTDGQLVELISFSPSSTCSNETSVIEWSFSFYWFAQIARAINLVALEHSVAMPPTVSSISGRTLLTHLHINE